MSLFKSGNPTLSENKFRDTVISISNENSMSIRGTLNKFGFMLLMLMGSAFYSWKEFAIRMKEYMNLRQDAVQRFRKYYSERRVLLLVDKS